MAPTIAKPLLSDLVAQTGQVPPSHVRPVGDRPDLARVDNESGAGIPLIDLEKLNGPERRKVVEATGRACEIARLPVDLTSLVFSHTTPRDACRAALVSRDFRSAADSDTVWSCFLPDRSTLADGELRNAPPSKKLFMRLSDGPVLLADGLVSMWMDRESGAKCFMLSARALCIVWGGSPEYWRWIPLTDSSFAEAAELLDVCWLEIRGNMDSQMLSKNTKYGAYMVFKIAKRNYELTSPLQEAAVSIGANRSSREVCLRPIGSPDEAQAQLPQRRADGWMELEMGEFFNEGADDGEVSISLMGIRGGKWKRGLIVHGIEIRAKK